MYCLIGLVPCSRESNAHLVPVMMQRLKSLQAETLGADGQADWRPSAVPRLPERPFAQISAAGGTHGTDCSVEVTA